jgi:ubiquinone/menaquinone biosynthesis C-methylase UbiE
MIDDVVTITKNTYDAISEKYAQLNKAYPVPLQTDSATFVSYIPSDGKVLDVGCGHGRDCAYFLSCNLTVTGIDVSERLLHIARATAPSAEFMVMDMRDVDFEDAVFDGLWCCASFLHIPLADATCTLHEFYRVLRDGGILFLSIQSHMNAFADVVTRYSPREKLVSTHAFGPDNLRFFTYYSLSEISLLLENCGFTVIQVSTNIQPKSQVMWMSIFAKK